MNYHNNIYTTEEIKQTVRKLIKEYYPEVEKVVLFGSYAKKTATMSSDIDLMVSGNKNFRGIKSVSFMSELKETLGKSVDLFLEKNINKNSNLYKNILRNGITIYE